MHLLDYFDTITVITALIFIYKTVNSISSRLAKLEGKMEIILIVLDACEEEKQNDRKERKRKQTNKLTDSALAS